MNGIAVDGIGLVGGFGCGLDALAGRLDQGSQPSGQIEFLRDGEAGNVPALIADPAPLERFLSKRATRRIDHFSKLALLGAFLALEDAGIPADDRSDLGVVVASGYGPTRTTFAFLDSLLDDGDSCASPTHFSNSVHNAAAAHVAMQLGAAGPNLTVSQFELSVVSALQTASGWLASGRVDQVLFGAVDELSPVLLHCRERLQSDAPAGLTGEGAAFFLLSRNGGRHGRIVGLETGSVREGNSLGSDLDLCLLARTGLDACDTLGARLSADGTPTADLLPHVGALPVGQAFDLAAALIALRRGSWPPTGQGLDGEVGCLQVDADGRYGLLRVAAAV
ncbi:MAG: beta-ketoacyl synthase [Desulfuromonas sp.]|nr:MAG: beta-ketoacyl synthase [Desulfuromonas sp.]